MFAVACVDQPAAQATRSIDARSAEREHGEFWLHKFEQRIGAEHWDVHGDPGGANARAVTIDFEFTDRGAPVRMTSTLLAREDWTPKAFELHGKSSRQSKIDLSIDAQAQTVLVQSDASSEQLPRPERFFAIGGYGPVAMQMLMMRYWRLHGSPSKLTTFPSREIRIARRGEDTFVIGGAARRFERFAIDGLVWGRETLWMDGADDLAALVSVDAEFDHFEALRPDLEPALGAFVAKAAEDGMDELAAMASAIPGVRGERVAIVGGTLIDATGSAPLDDSAIVIDSGRIVAVGPRARTEIPRDAKLVDARGEFVLPGLWDMHAHFEQVEWGPVYLAAGATTVRDCGNELEFITAVRDAIASQRGLGPRILAAGIVDGSGPQTCGVQVVDDEAQAREWVDRYHDLGFQQIKVYSSMKLENVAAVAREAHRLGMTVTGHIANGVDLRRAVEAGQDQINHVGYVLIALAPEPPKNASNDQILELVRGVDPDGAAARDLFEFLRRHRTVVDPTLAFTEFTTASRAHPLESFEPGALDVPRELAAGYRGINAAADVEPMARAVFEKQLALVGALHRAGIPIVTGTDQVVPGHSLHREIELYVQAGFTPLEAIQAATIVPARAMNLDGESGSIEVGKRADLILIDGDPLADIRNLRKVRSVMTVGVLYDCAALWRSVGFRP